MIAKQSKKRVPERSAEIVLALVVEIPDRGS